MAIDRFGRKIHYLRISLTDRCNLRCVYCMPESMRFRPRPELMTDEEVLSLARVFADLGFDKFRLTGGEPTMREGLVDLVGGLRRTPGVDSISMTTNGLLLEKLAEPLARAGLKRVNVSLDTLDPERFHRITRWGRLDKVWAGIVAAERAGLAPIKINAVVVRGFNEQDLPAMAALTLEHPWQVRFIEVMPFAGPSELQQGSVVPAAEMMHAIEQALGPLEPLLEEGSPGRPILDGEARLYRLSQAEGTLGFISSVTQPFCAQCTRARLTADGRLRLCLLREKEVDLLSPLRAGASIEEIEKRILEGVWFKPWGHGLAHNVFAHNRVMNEIGG
ncbi:MAG: GTP 3',8-cyclase MoaA [Anaerolineales bacterium]|jgi:cyclic pyranopterin phosphate synthase